MGFKPQQNPSGLEIVNEFMERIRMAIDKAKSTNCKAQNDIKRYYDRRRTLAPVFNPSDKVFLNELDIQTTCPLQKLLHQWLGPVTNFIRPYLHQFSIDSHGLNGYGKPLKRPFDRYQSRLEAISNGRDIRQINW